MEVFQDKQIKVCRLCMEVLQPGVGVLSEGSPIMKDFNDRLLQLVPNIVSINFNLTILYKISSNIFFFRI